jgi:sortase A
MLLKVGAAVITLSLVLTAGVAAVVLRSETSATGFSANPRATVEKTAQEREFDLGQKLEIEDEVNEDGGVLEEDNGNIEDDGPSQSVQTAEKAVPKQEPEPVWSPTPRPRAKSALTPEPVPDWPEPTSEQVASAGEPRYYQSSSDTDMTLTIIAVGLYNVPVLNSANLEVLDRGLMHEPESSLPWDDEAQRNVFIAGHYLGWPGTASHLVFYNLDKLRRGDEIVLKDGQRRTYRYRVSEAFEATPEDSWVMGQERDRDMLTLQTCIPPTFEDRLVVRADRA